MRIVRTSDGQGGTVMDRTGRTVRNSNGQCLTVEDTVETGEIKRQLGKART